MVLGYATNNWILTFLPLDIQSADFILMMEKYCFRNWSKIVPFFYGLRRNN